MWQGGVSKTHTEDMNTHTRMNILRPQVMGQLDLTSWSALQRFGHVTLFMLSVAYREQDHLFVCLLACQSSSEQRPLLPATFLPVRWDFIRQPSNPVIQPPVNFLIPELFVAAVWCAETRSLTIGEKGRLNQS